MDQAHPLRTSAWLSGQGRRWVSRQSDAGDVDSLLIWATLDRTLGHGQKFWEAVILAPAQRYEALLEAERAEFTFLYGRPL